MQETCQKYLKHEKKQAESEAEEQFETRQKNNLRKPDKHICTNIIAF